MGTVLCSHNCDSLNCWRNLLAHLEEMGNITPNSFMMTLVDGSKFKREIQTTIVKASLGGRILTLNFVEIPDAKKNNSFVGIDFFKIISNSFYP